MRALAQDFASCEVGAVSSGLLEPHATVEGARHLVDAGQVFVNTICPWRTLLLDAVCLRFRWSAARLRTGFCEPANAAALTAAQAPPALADRWCALMHRQRPAYQSAARVTQKTMSKRSKPCSWLLACHSAKVPLLMRCVYQLHEDSFCRCAVRSCASCALPGLSLTLSQTFPPQFAHRKRRKLHHITLECARLELPPLICLITPSAGSRVRDFGYARSTTKHDHALHSIMWLRPQSCHRSDCTL